MAEGEGGKEGRSGRKEDEVFVGVARLRLSVLFVSAKVVPGLQGTNLG